MAQVPQQQSSSGPDITEAFIADRQMFWHRFTGFTTYAVIAVVVLLILLWFFFG